MNCSQSFCLEVVQSDCLLSLLQHVPKILNELKVFSSLMTRAYLKMTMPGFNGLELWKSWSETRPDCLTWIGHHRVNTLNPKRTFFVFGMLSKIGPSQQFKCPVAQRPVMLWCNYEASWLLTSGLKAGLLISCVWKKTFTCGLTLFSTTTLELIFFGHPIFH